MGLITLKITVFWILYLIAWPSCMYVCTYYKVNTVYRYAYLRYMTFVYNTMYLLGMCKNYIFYKKTLHMNVQIAYLLVFHSLFVSSRFC